MLDATSSAIALNTSGAVAQQEHREGATAYTADDIKDRFAASRTVRYYDRFEEWMLGKLPEAFLLPEKPKFDHLDLLTPANDWEVVARIKKGEAEKDIGRLAVGMMRLFTAVREGRKLRLLDRRETGPFVPNLFPFWVGEQLYMGIVMRYYDKEGWKSVPVWFCDVLLPSKKQFPEGSRVFFFDS